MPIQFPDMMPVPSAEEHNPFLNQFSKALQVGLGYPRQLQQMDIVNALKQMEAQKMQAEAPYWGQMAKADLGLKQAQQHETEALAGFHGEQAQREAWMRKHGYPTPDMQTLGYLQQIGGNIPSQQPPVTTGVQTSSKFDQQTATVPTILNQAQQNAALDSQIYAGAPPNLNVVQGLNPLAQAFVAQKYPDPNAQFKTQLATADLNNNFSLIQEKQKELSATSDAANNLIPTIEKMDSLYDQMSIEKGRLGGNLPAWSSQAVEFDKYAQQVINENAVVLGKGKTFGYDFVASKGSKISRDMPEDAYIGLSTLQKSKVEDAREEQAFYAKGSVPQPNGQFIRAPLLKQAWNAYKRNRPTMNFEPGQFYKNTAYQDTWNDYLTPEALRSIAQTGNYIPPNQKILKKQNVESQDIYKLHSAIKSLDSKVSKIGAIKILENPDLLHDSEFEKIKNKIPRNVIIYWIKIKQQRGEQ